jgi:hypothetical protein
MAGIDFTAMANLLEKDINPTVKVQVYKRAPMWEIFGGFQSDVAASQGMQYAEKRVNPNQVSFKNNTIFVTIQNGRPTTGGINISEKFQYGVTPLDQGSLSIATETGSFLIPKQVLKTKDGGAIKNILQYNIQSITNAMAQDLNRQCYGDGTATLAYCAASGTSTTTINLVPKAAASTFYNGDIPLARRYFTVGMLVKIGTNAVTTITQISGDNQIKVAAAQTFAQYAAVIKQSGSSTTATEVNGLASIVNTNLYMGINPTNDAEWKAYVSTNGGVARTTHNSMADMNTQYFNANVVGNVQYVVMNNTVFAKYGAELTGNVRFTVKEALSGGWRSLEFMGGNSQVILDPDCTDDRVYMLSPENLFRAELQPLEWEPGTLGNGQRLVGQLDYELVADWIGNIGCDLRSSNAVLTNIVG